MKGTFVWCAFVGAVVASVTLIGSVALAGTGIGSMFNLGATNTVNASSVLQGSTNGQQFRVVNSHTGAAATGIGIHTSAGVPPLAVSSAAKVTNLNADLLDGHDSSAFQRRVSGTCSNGDAINSVSSGGTVGCTSSAVIPIARDIASGAPAQDQEFAGSNMTLSMRCNLLISTPDFAFAVANTAPSSGFVNWMFSQGGTTSTVDAEGATIAAGTEEDFTLGGNRLEGQFIYAESSIVITVNLHVFDLGSSCEYRGTAEFAHT